MSDIDPEKLEEAIIAVENVAWGPGMAVVVTAARAHLATLPRYKEVEVVRFAVVNTNTGDINAMFHADDEVMANRHASEVPCFVVVRLTGTAKVRA